MILPRRHIDSDPGEWRQLLRGASGDHDPEQITRWEKEFAVYLGRRHAIAVGSGRFAMKILLAALELPAGSEVVIPAYTLKDLLPLISSLDLVPVAADIDPDHWNINAATVAPVLSDRTRVILALHLFGNPAPMLELRDLAAAHRLRLIEDCAHSAGSFLGGRPTGSFGDDAFFSFESIKPINTYGGGLVVTDDDELAARLREAAAVLLPCPTIRGKVLAAAFERFMFKSGLAALPLALLATTRGQALVTRIYRRIQPAPRQPWGYSAGQAALGHIRLATLARRTLARRQQAARLTALLPRHCQPQQTIATGLPNYYFFVVRVAGDAARLRRVLLRHGMDAGYGAEIADDCGAVLSGLSCPAATELSRQALLLPLHEGTSERNLKRLARLLDQYGR